MAAKARSRTPADNVRVASGRPLVMVMSTMPMIRVVPVQGGSLIEMTPIPDRHGDRRGVVAEGAVGSRWLGKLRRFRYEIHRWSGGVIPDADHAVATMTLHLGIADAQRLLAAVPYVPTPVWGRDELGAGEMWNSNSVTSWILQRAGIDTAHIAPPIGGRAPGWSAGLVMANRCRESRGRISRETWRWDAEQGSVR